MVVVMLSIMVSLAVPGMRGLIANSRATSLVNELVTSINLARSEAAMRGMTVSVCALTVKDGDECAKSADEVEWASGWVVFTDQAGTTGEIDEDDQILRRFSVPSSAGAFKGDAAFVSYQASGLLLQDPVSWQLRDKQCTKNSDRDVNLSATGRPSTKHVDC